MKEIMYQPFAPERARFGRDRVVVFIAHPDDEHLIGTVVFERFRAAGYDLVIASATRGERGKIHGASLPARRVRAIRTAEFAASTSALGATGVYLDPVFPDGALPKHQNALNDAALRFVRSWNASWVYSFAPGPNFPLRFAHLDHDAVATAAAYASQMADMEGILEDSANPPLQWRPRLLGWTVNPYLGPSRQYAQVELSRAERNNRDDMLAEHHASQFEPGKRGVWSGYFNDITRYGSGKKHRQLLFQIR